MVYRKDTGMPHQYEYTDKDGNKRIITTDAQDRLDMNDLENLGVVKHIPQGAHEHPDGAPDYRFCYLTSACVDEMGLDDNCGELTILRNFRDRIMKTTPEGISSLKEYYRIAPDIVQEVNQKINSSEIWQKTYKDIREAVQLVLSGDYNQAFAHYKDMTRRLSRE